MDTPQPQPVSLASPRSEGPLPAGAVELGGPEAVQLKEQVRQENLSALREYLRRTRQEEDWQDRLFMLDLVVPGIPIEVLDASRAAEPEAADITLIRCAYFCDLALKQRGTGTGDTVTQDRIKDSLRFIQAAVAALDKAAQLDPQDPTGHAYVLRPLGISGEFLPRLHQAFQAATQLAPDLVPAHYSMVTTLSERWYGTHEKSLQAARSAMSRAGAGHDMSVCLFWAHFLVWSHLGTFDKNPQGAKAYRQRPDVRKELDTAFERWLDQSYKPRRSSIPYLHVAAGWYYLAGDRPRLQRALALTNSEFSDRPWRMMGRAQDVYSRALLVAAGKAPPPGRQGLLTRLLRAFSK